MTRRDRARPSRALRADDFARDYTTIESGNRAPDRKTGQLCAQVKRTLAFLLETECCDASLQGLYIEAVLPNPNAACLLVVLRPSDRRRPFDLKLVLRRLAALKGYWRAQIAAAIHRKKTPELVFQVLLEGGRP